MYIKKCTPDDCGRLAALNRKLIEDEGRKRTTTTEQLKKRMAAYLAGDYEAVFFIEGTSVVGYGLIRKNVRPVCLRHFYVCDDSRKKGCGIKAMRALMDYYGQDSLDVEVMGKSLKGSLAWERLGFKPESLLMRFTAESLENAERRL